MAPCLSARRAPKHTQDSTGLSNNAQAIRLNRECSAMTNKRCSIRSPMTISTSSPHIEKRSKSASQSFLLLSLCLTRRGWAASAFLTFLVTLAAAATTFTPLAWCTFFTVATACWATLVSHFLYSLCFVFVFDCPCFSLSSSKHIAFCSNPMTH